MGDWSGAIRQLSQAELDEQKRQEAEMKKMEESMKDLERKAKEQEEQQRNYLAGHLFFTCLPA